MQSKGRPERLAGVGVVSRGGAKRGITEPLVGSVGLVGLNPSCVARKQRGKGREQAPLGEDTYHLRRRRNCMRGILPAEEGEGEGEGEHMRAWCCLPVT